MKFVIAPDSFKESLTALQAAEAIEKGVKEVFPDAECVLVPMADGGEGTVQSLVDATGGEIVTCKVTGPMDQPVDAFYGLLGDKKTAVIEMAAASGLQLVPREQRNPLLTTTRGTGELILHALDLGVTHIILGLGGSATNDGGAGVAQALGVRLLDQNGKDLGSGGGELGKLDQIDISGLDPRLQQVTFEVACDVDNPLTGPKGASAVFGPQKGATSQQVAFLDKNLAHYAKKLKECLGKDVDQIEGAGAAGGLGAGVLAFFQCELKRGIQIVIEATGLAKHVQDADFVITGEGRVDFQTIHGKTPIGVAKTAKQYHVPVIGIAGCLTEESNVVHEHGIDLLFPIIPHLAPLEEILQEGAQNMERTARNVAMSLKLGAMLQAKK
ncbi:glycerate kinase [Brevibacillus laterosporus]|nr:glycerate kinase [Brevibacillus laterosporus]TPG69462.1 glycerate kinase [Brevibacillus laterosporus]TPG91295.1 glycerate kinase [Brevibacillus laterosporus]